MLIDGQEISPEYEKALKDVNVALHALHDAPGGDAAYRQALAHAVAVKKKENPMNLKDAMEATGVAQGNLRGAVLGAQEAQKYANSILRIYQSAPRASVRERWEKAMVRVANCDEAVGLYVRALSKAEEDLAEAKSAAGPETYTVDQIAAVYEEYTQESSGGPDLKALIEALRSGS